MGAASSLERLSSVMPSIAAEGQAHQGKPKPFSPKEIQIMHKYLPSFVYQERSTEAHRHIAAVHWDLAFKDPPVQKHDLSSRTSQREVGHIAEQQTSKVMRLYDVFFAYLEENSPELKPVFRSSLHVRGKVLVHISVGMRTLIVSENFMDKIISLTKTHRRFGVKLEHYEPLGRALFHAMQAVSGAHWTPEVDDAWRRLFSHTSVVLIAAQQKVDARVAKEAAKPLASGKKADLMTSPGKNKTTGPSTSMADFVPQFFLNRKGSARDTALTGTTLTTGTSLQRGTESTPY